MKITHLAKHFIALGLAANLEIATSFFRNLIETQEEVLTAEMILQYEINIDTFLTLFQTGDFYAMRILNVLNKEVREKHA